ncbi:nitrous oxide-stimulated promoter family protein [Coriobacteriia bacterium Es71-Z0120]|uniref:nitrous oxide-stimulated promoter family protein n=1 Tax=Parvivirga hydrogeniphila TaxID=2939460 RepID=UPI002260D44B|nr:nitrous oxide-stimulated promoter family protein [Parvivirga hydrogeniphila]MCL4078159.1 nitrous oxide-stimulated promoter family protein [Parvivirga hydrogeniphila]
MADALTVRERIAARMRDRKVAHDVRTLGDFIEIFCAGTHKDRDRRPAATLAAELGVYGARPPRLCEECEAHLAYGEKRRALCPKDPKPFCAHCDTHCYKSDEREWQRQMMRYSGPRSVLRGHAIDAIRHALESRAHRAAQRRATSAGEDAR